MMQHRLAAPGPLFALMTVVVACDGDFSADEARLELDPTSSSVALADEGDALTIDARMRLTIAEESHVSIEGVTVTTFTASGETTIEEPDVTSESLPFEGVASSLGLAAQIEIPAPAWGDDFLRGCDGGAIDISLRLRVESGDGSHASFLDAAMKLPLSPPAAIAPAAFGTPVIIEVAHAGDQSGEAQAVATPLGDALFMVGTGTYAVVYRGDEDSVSLVQEGFTWLDQPRARMTSAADGDAIVGGRSGPFAIDLHRVELDGTQINGMIETSPWPAVEAALELAALGRAPAGAFAVVRSAAPVVVVGVEHPAPTDKYYGSFVVELDDALVPVAVTLFDRDILAYDVFEDGSAILVSAALPPSDDTTTRIERRSPAGDVIWTHVISESPSDLIVRPLSDGGALLGYGRFDGSSHGTEDALIFARLSGVDGTVMWEHQARGSAASIAARDDGGAIVTFTGTDSTVDLAMRGVATLIEVSPVGELLRTAPLACKGTGVVIDAADGSTILAGSYTGQLTLGESIVAAAEGRLFVSRVD